MNQCKHRGRKSSCCQSIYECSNPEVPVPTCTPDLEGFSQIISKNPAITLEVIGSNLHVCSECPHRETEDE